MRNFSLSFLLTGIILSVVYKNNHDVPSDTGLLKQIYEVCADTVELDTSRYFLETYLCRNLTSVRDRNTSGSITALIYLLDAHSQQIPKNVYIRNIYVVKEKGTWASSPATSQTGMAKFMLTQVNSDDPAGEKFNVDVIVEVTDSASLQSYFVIARNQSFSDL